MPKRRRPRTNGERDAALRNGKNRKDTIPALPVIPYTPATIAWLDAFQPAYRLKYQAVMLAKNAQTGFSSSIVSAQRKAILYEQDFIDALNKAIRRGEMQASVRSLYNLNVNSSALPKITTESDVITWLQNITAGETARIATGGAPITFPSLAQVTAEVNAFNLLNQQQENAKALYDTAQEELAAMNPEADKLILKMWNETETAFDEGDIASKRRKSRQWGVVYVNSAGEALSPEDFSIRGKVRVEGTGSTPGIEEAEITVLETNTVVLSESNGDFLVPFHDPGSYTLLVEKPGHVSKTISGVVVVAGAITELNIFLTPTGAVEGTAMQNALPVDATIEVLGTGLTATTDPQGNYYRGDVPAGQQTIRCTINGSNPALYIDNIVIVNAGGALTVNFVFP